MATQKVEVPVIPRNQFMLEEYPIGRGGFGTVFRGQHTKLGLVAVKTLIDTGLLPQKHLKALQSEAERLRTVCQHPCILNLHGIITEKDNYSLVLEYMPLGSANEFRKDFTVQWPLIVQIIRDVIDGMTFLHGHNPLILHLDLKADNILLDKGVRAKISDFGLSEWKNITMTVTRGEGGGQSSARRCTVSHVPPEVWSNVNLPSDRYYDIYSFGIIIWELLSGEFPYKAAAEELIRSAVLSGQRPDFIQIPKDCPMFLTKMMTRCWHQKPTQRPAFKDLKPEIEDEFEKNYRRTVVKSLKNIRREITQKFPSTDPIYFFTNEIDSMAEPVEPVPSTSANTTPKNVSTTPKVVDAETHSESKQTNQKTEEEKTVPKVLFKKTDDLTTEEKEIHKILFSPTACRLAKSRYFNDIFKVSEETRQTLVDPVKRRKLIEADETLARQVRYSKFNAFDELDGEFYDFRTSVGRQWTEAFQKDIYDRQRRSYNKDRGYGSSNSEETERGKKHKRASDSLEKNPAMKKLRNGGAYYKVKKILENPDMLKQSLEDKRKGVDSSLRLTAIDSESLELLKNPFLLMMVFGNEYDIKGKFKDNYRDLFMQMFSNAPYKGSFPTGGYKLPESMKDMIPHWLESEMTKEGWDVDRIQQIQDSDRRRRRYQYGMNPDSDDDDYDDYPPMRYLSRRMMDVNVKPGSGISEKLDGYQLRRMVSDVERNCGNKTDLAKKVIRILSRPPKEERDEERKREKERRSAGHSSSGYGPMSHARDPMEMMMMMGMGSDPSRIDEKTLRQIMKMEQRNKMKEMKSSNVSERLNMRTPSMFQKQSLLKRKSSSSPTSSKPMATKTQSDLETDASGSIPDISVKSGEKGPSNPPDPKKSKSDLETDSKGSSSESTPKLSTSTDGSVEIEHKSSGVFGGLTKLFFGKSAKVPNMQVGDKNVMHIGRHFDDSDDDDYMPDSSYDKTYQPPSNARPPTKLEIDKIASKIHGDYRNLGRQLKVPYNAVEQVVEDYKKEGMHEVTYQMVKKWQELNGDAATNVVLANALHKMRRDDLSRFLRF
ncbi:uncharacterized protein LOC134721406 isoform X1 [Mytilus trossulus]|uniref:uncharacterized protein LOC134721406 isoform X1 n=1 Tax=Mytilus trossulus TaxID=6551 RepID=UPI003007DF42